MLQTCVPISISISAVMLIPFRFNFVLCYLHFISPRCAMFPKRVFNFAYCKLSFRKQRTNKQIKGQINTTHFSNKREIYIPCFYIIAITWSLHVYILIPYIFLLSFIWFYSSLQLLLLKLILFVW